MLDIANKFCIPFKTFKAFFPFLTRLMTMIQRIKKKKNQTFWLENLISKVTFEP